MRFIETPRSVPYTSSLTSHCVIASAKWAVRPPIGQPPVVTTNLSSHCTWPPSYFGEASRLSNMTDFDDSDWTLFGKTRPLTVDDLQRFSSAQLDPFTVQLAQKLCERFTFSAQGLRNLSSALLPLIEGQAYRGTFDIGYNSSHVINTTLKSDFGFVLTAVVGSLAEYYDEDFIVRLFKLLVTESGVPQRLTPSDTQWRQMVDVLYGVLATSPFGTLLGELEEKCAVTRQHANPSTVLEAMHIMSDLARHKGRPTEHVAGADVVWIATAARWLFDLKVVVQSSTGEDVYKSVGVQSSTEADLKLRLPNASTDTSNLSSNTSQSASAKPSGNNAIKGGRIGFDDVFRSCFREAFTTLDNDLIASYIIYASQILQESLQKSGVNPRNIFLAQASGRPGESAHGLIETLRAWFPEINRLLNRPNLPKHLEDHRARKMLDDIYLQLQASCPCSMCQDSVTTAAEVCSVMLAEFIFDLGLVISRMVVFPKLRLKRNGVLALYHRQHAERKARGKKTSSTPSEGFSRVLTDKLPTLLEILEAGFLLFADSEVHGDEKLVGMSHAGLSVFFNGQKETHEPLGTKTRIFAGVSVVPGRLCLYGHEARKELYEEGLEGRSLDETWEVMRLDYPEYNQIMKWRGQDMIVSFVKKGSKEERQTLEAGWLIV